MARLNEVSPCYGCGHRKQGCHPTCNDFKRWKEDHEKELAKYYKYKEYDNTYRDFKIKKMEKERRNGH